MADKQQSGFKKILVFILFGFLVLSFGLWGIGDIFRGGGQATTVATVGEREITVQAYDRALRDEIRRLQQSAGNSLTREQLVALGVEQRALQPLIQRALVQAWAEDVGLVVTEQQLLDQIAREPAFQVEGRFSQQRYELTLRDAGYTEATFLAALAFDILRENLLDPVREAAELPASESERLFAHLAERRVADYLLLASATFDEALGEPEQAALEQVYEDYAAQFEAPEYRRITLLHLTPDQFRNEVQVSDEQARAFYEENAASFAEPARRSLLMVSYDSEEEAQAALAEVQGGRPLAEVAADSGRTPTTLNGQTEQQLGAVLSGLEEAVFGLDPEARYGIGESLLGWHLFEVTEASNASERSFEEARAEIVDALELRGAGEALDSIAAQVDEEVSSGATLPEVSERLNLPLREIEAIDRDGRDRNGEALENLPSPAQFLPEVFRAEVGLETLLLQAADGSWFAFRLEEVMPPATRPFAEVETEVRALWARLERRRLASEAAEELVVRINEQGATLAEIAAEREATVQTTQPLARDETSPDMTPAAGLAAALFAAEPGQAVTAAGEQGAVVAVLRDVQRTTAGEDAERFGNLTANLKEAVENDLVTLMVRSLQQTYPVEINQQALDSVGQNF